MKIVLILILISSTVLFQLANCQVCECCCKGNCALEICTRVRCACSSILEPTTVTTIKIKTIKSTTKKTTTKKTTTKKSATKKTKTTDVNIKKIQ